MICNRSCKSDVVRISSRCEGCKKHEAESVLGSVCLSVQVPCELRQHGDQRATLPGGGLRLDGPV